ncbi:ATP-binding protein [Bradyrhizobium sp. DASA03120]|uniref:ATP-binding protein n=1 Tax=Bradyrhizobium sp. SMVTL-02 TaxID=3395917 RepID=UPI003F719CE6
MGARALDILIALVSRPNETIGKKELLSLVWPDIAVEEYSLRFHMTNLRRALGDGKDGARYIATLAGRGYCFVAPVTRLCYEVDSPSVATDSSHANLPSRLAHMVGRDEDIQRISDHLITDRFVSIVGIGGVGKTTVAIAVGHHLIEAFKGAVLIVDLSVLSDPGLVATAIASMLGLSVQSENATPALIAYLRSKRMLLILDTCEHLVDAIAGLTSQIYAEAPSVYILATSREVLQVEGEHVYRLDTLSYPPEEAEIESTAAQDYPAPRLFIERAAASGAQMNLNDAEIAVVVRICRKLDGVALAIELAARRVEAYGLHQTENLLDRHLTLPLLGHRSTTPRQRTLQATLDWSYQLLSELERTVLRRLAVFVGHFTLNAALSVVTDIDIDQSQALGAIDSLVAKSMVATRPLGAMMRYRLLDTTRAYALNLATTGAEATELAARHAKYYQRWLEQSGSDWPTLSTGPEKSPYFAALNNTRSALEWCFGDQGSVRLGTKLAATAAPVFLTMSLLPECRRWSERAIAELDDTSRGGAEEMQLQASLGVASMHIDGPSEAALAALSRSLVIAEACGNVLGQVMMLWMLSLFFVRQAEFRTALDYAKRARAIAGTIDEPDATALAQSALGRALHFVGDYTDARPELEAALNHWSSTHRIFLGIDERILTGVVLMRTLWAQGFAAQAVERARQTISDAKLSSNPATLAVALSWVSGVLIWAGDLQSAEEHVDWLIPHAESHSLGPNVHVGRSYKGTLAINSGDPKAGVQTLQECLKHLHTHDKKLNMALGQRKVEFNISLAQGLIAIGRADEGLAIIDETISRIDENGELYLLPEALRMRGCALLALPERGVNQAEACFMQSLALSRRQGARAWELRTAIDLARLLVNCGRRADGRKLLQPILGQFTQSRETADQRTAAQLLAELDQD